MVPEQVFPGLIHANLFFLHSDCSDYLEADQMNGVRFLAGMNWHSSLAFLQLMELRWFMPSVGVKAGVSA